MCHFVYQPKRNIRKTFNINMIGVSFLIKMLEGGKRETKYDTIVSQELLTKGNSLILRLNIAGYDCFRPYNPKTISGDTFKKSG